MKGCRKSKNKIGEFASTFNDLVDSHNECEDSISWIQSKLADLEDRSRRNNVKVCRIPESVKPQELQAYFFNILREALPDSPPEELIIDCIHRLPKPKHDPEHLNRDTIVRLHFYNIKEKCKSLTRNNERLPRDTEIGHFSLTSLTTPCRLLATTKLLSNH